MKPMLAAPARLESLRFPLLLSPKLDGVRCIIHRGQALSRSLKPIPNLRVQRLFGDHRFDGLDGELIVGEPTAKGVFSQTSGGVMSVRGEPDVTFYVFDDFSCAGPFGVRLDHAARRAGDNPDMADVPHHEVMDDEEMYSYEERYVALGYEGVMLRDPAGPYKLGRCTTNEGWLLKLKRFQDAEAVVLGCIEQLENTNEAKRNELGQLERSSAKAGLVPTGKLGALRVKDIRLGVEFDIGTGFTDAQRLAYWATRDSLTHRLVKYKSQLVGAKDRPRFPVFLGFRDPIDF